MYSLFLYPEHSRTQSISAQSLEKCLTDNKFVSSSRQQNCFQHGQQLMEYINFLGCSPAVASAEIETTIHLHSFNTLTAMGGDSIETIRYPSCKHPVNDSARLLKNYTPQKRWQCPFCGNQGEIDQINWRKTAGISTLFIEISPVFPREAIPTDKLLHLLQNYSQSNWRWFYSKSSF